MNILGVKIDNLNKKEIIEKIKVFLAGDRFCQIATVNPEFILRTREDEEFKNILNSCDLNVADGVGIWFAFLRFGKYLKSRMAGADLMEEILKIASEKNCKIFLAASEKGLSSWQETKNAILKKYPNLEISGGNLKFPPFEKGGLKGDFYKKDNDKNPSLALPFTKGENIVFCNFGAPEQEKFLHSLKPLKNGLPHHLCSESSSKALLNNNLLNNSDFDLQNQRWRGNIKLAMGVGGSFDFITGKIRRAPLLMRKLGIEWIWRFILEPQYRFKRIVNAIIVFPVRILFSKNDQ